MARISVEEYHQLLRNLGQTIPGDGDFVVSHKRSKYNAKKVPLDGFIFDSKKEAQVYVEKKWELCAGLITDLWVHTRFPLVVGEKIIGHYEDDLDFVEVKTQEWIVLDVKSEHTRKLPMYQRNRKHMLQQYGINILEVIR